ncbi:ras-like protein RAS2 [Dendronephthya gigantea]|uniref:ras-like protein RAS2 n=1 Tax=Dendronephthya gigantea TaxID=151771 RepID=UPI0010697206|nr:ras-like protein RAS2 [Dendronephthya gigantea]
MSTLLVRFLTGRYIVDYDPTIEDTYRKIYVCNDEPESIDILDTATTGNVKSELRKDFLKYGDAFIIVYSVTDRSSFDMVPVFRQEILDAREMKDKPHVKLVGNKSDQENERQVTTFEGKKMATKYDWTFCEASAASNVGIQDVFFGLNEVNKDSIAKVLGSSSDSDSACSGDEMRVKTKKKSSHRRRSAFGDFKIFRRHSQQNNV